MISKIEGSEITVATTNGFELKFQANELVKIKDPRMMSSSLFSKKSLESVLSEKATKKRVNPPKVSSKERTQPAMEVDLHINQLVKNSPIKNLRELTDKKEAQKSFSTVSSMIDKLAKNNIIHNNKAANLKSGLSKFVAAL